MFQTIGKRIGLGFGVVLGLLFLLALLNFFGVGRIVGDAGRVIEGNKLNAELAQREVDHLNWATKVSGFLLDDQVAEFMLKINGVSHHVTVIPAKAGIQGSLLFLDPGFRRGDDTSKKSENYLRVKDPARSEGHISHNQETQ